MLFPATSSSVALKALTHNTASLHTFVLCFEIPLGGVFEHVPHRLTGIQILGSQLVTISGERVGLGFIAPPHLQFTLPLSTEEVIFQLPESSGCMPAAVPPLP